jgi:hypothetical protein
MKRSSHSSALLLLGGLLLTMSGCMSPPVFWKHDSRTEVFERSGQPLLVAPIKDLREPHNEDASWLNLMPGMLWTSEDDRMFDWILLRNGTRKHAQPDSALTFLAERDLQRAMADQIGKANLFAPVFIRPEHSGRWNGKPLKTYLLKTRIHKLGIKTFYLRYGLGPAAFVAHSMRLPNRRLRLDVDIEIELCDPKGKGLYSNRIKAVARFNDGWYTYEFAEQLVFNEISIIIGEEVDRIHEFMAKHFKQALATPGSADTLGRSESCSRAFCL